MANKIVHWEIMGPDGASLHDFYASVFGWSGEAVPGFDHYYLIDADEVGMGGAVGKGSAEMPNYVAMYVEVDAIDDHLAQIEAAGGTTIVPRTVVPNTVVFALFADPAGNMVGIVEPDQPVG